MSNQTERSTRKERTGEVETNKRQHTETNTNE